MNRTIVSIAVAVLLIGAGYFLGRLHGDVERMSLSRAVEGMRMADSLGRAAVAREAEYRAQVARLIDERRRQDSAVKAMPQASEEVTRWVTRYRERYRSNAEVERLFREVCLRKLPEE